MVDKLFNKRYNEVIAIEKELRKFATNMFLLPNGVIALESSLIGSVRFAKTHIPYDEFMYAYYAIESVHPYHSKFKVTKSELSVETRDIDTFIKIRNADDKYSEYDVLILNPSNIQSTLRKIYERLLVHLNIPNVDNVDVFKFLLRETEEPEGVYLPKNVIDKVICDKKSAPIELFGQTMFLARELFGYTNRTEDICARKVCEDAKSIIVCFKQLHSIGSIYTYARFMKCNSI